MSLLVAMLLASAAAEAAPSGMADAAPAEDKVTCKRMEVSGTRLGGKRECRTRSEWEELRRVARDDMRRLTEDRAAPQTRSD